MQSQEHSPEMGRIVKKIRNAFSGKEYDQGWLTEAGYEFWENNNNAEDFRELVLHISQQFGYDVNIVEAYIGKVIEQVTMNMNFDKEVSQKIREALSTMLSQITEEAHSKYQLLFDSNYLDDACITDLLEEIVLEISEEQRRKAMGPRTNRTTDEEIEKE